MSKHEFLKEQENKGVEKVIKEKKWDIIQRNNKDLLSEQSCDVSRWQKIQRKKIPAKEFEFAKTEAMFSVYQLTPAITSIVELYAFT